jgi:hypothetical protein
VLSAQRGKVAELASLVGEIPDLVEHVAYAAQLLLCASMAGRIDVVEWLLDLGVDVNKPWSVPVSVIGGGFELVLFRDAAVRSSHDTPFGGEHVLAWPGCPRRHLYCRVFG